MIRRSTGCTATTLWVTRLQVAAPVGAEVELLEHGHVAQATVGVAAEPIEQSVRATA